ncbi:MAG: DUF3604 domain-containing protein [Gammaproteobacteria bacterium]|nr:DUF3604 domain-containing protein [Gammaproteobacteria bacterium]
MHRNVIFRSEVVPRLPLSFVDTGSAERLWEMLDSECRESLPGCEVLAIPHNANLSAGYMFNGLRTDGAPYTVEDARLRLRSEPLLEIMQHKGASECRRAARDVSRPMSIAISEILPYDSFGGQNMKWRRHAPTRKTGFLRDILRDGLRLEQQLGINLTGSPEVIGGTDSHIGAAGGASEDTSRGARRSWRAGARWRAARVA